MPEAVSTEKDPLKVKAGKAGAEVRWTAERRTTVRLDALTSEQRAVVLALVAAARKSGDDAS
jgi:hypothetical protein